MVFRAVLTVVLLIFPTVEALQGYVSFKGEKVTLTCPEKGDFFKKGGGMSVSSKKYYEYTYKGDKDLYYCEYQKTEGGTVKTEYYFFYVKGKACSNCIELDAVLFAGVIVADVIGTVIVMVIIYKCTKKRAPGAPKHANNAVASSRQADIPMNSPYESLSLHTRAQDPYSVINRTG